MIEIDAVIKGGFADFHVELEKAQALQRLSRDQSFVVPRVLEASQADSSISFEYLPGLVPIRNKYLEACRGAIPLEPVEKLFAATGDALSRIHIGLRLAKEVDWRPSQAFEFELRAERCLNDLHIPEIAMPVVLHGDYGFANVFLMNEDDPRLVILDPSPNGFTTFAANERGPRGIDLANMVACIQGLVPLRYYPFLNWASAARLLDAFLSGYERAADCRLPRKPLIAIARATARTYLRYRCRWNWQRESARRIFFWSRKRELLHRE